MVWTVLGKFEHLDGQVDLQKPKEKWQVVASIKSVPKWTDSKCVTLIKVFVLKRRPLINASSEPKLRTNVPIWHFFPQMYGAFNFPRITCLDPFEFSLSIVADSRSMNCTLTQFPSKIIFESNKSDWKERKVKNVQRRLISKGRIFHYWQREVNHM